MGNLLGSPVVAKETHTGFTSDGSLEYGVSSMQGWRIHMEDAHICQPFLYAEEPIVARTAADSEKEEGTNPATEDSASSSKANDEEAGDAKYRKIPIPDHSLYAVFDGHGGSFAAEYSGLNLCRILSRQPSFVKYAQYVHDQAERDRLSANIDPTAQAQFHREGLEMLESALKDAFVEMDMEILREIREWGNTDANTPYGQDYDHGGGVKHCSSNHETSETGSNDEGSETQERRMPQPNSGEDSGTTAVVVIITPQWIICANAGDSRAVYSKGGHRAIPLSYDHKPDDEAEERRIKEAGGYVSGGRVEGDLAVSRGLGDYRFKVLDTVMSAGAYNSSSKTNGSTAAGNRKRDNSVMSPEDQKVSPIPDVIVQTRNAEQDEFIVVACDGIWDVQSNQECVSMISNIFSEGESNIGLICEEVLDLCLEKGSKDNMTTLIVKMPAQKTGQGGGVKARRESRGAGTKKENDKDDGNDLF